ncbi:UBP1-associated proteins 1C isoform X2 [Beta vulgaris subsp. vulgaris]|nr:UBP1-associated proteins 1C isoform X2 [Beta vulgaris subsp. vulgaris]
MFDQQRVQAHTQCITEAEKYGPKGQAKTASGTPAKSTKPKPDVDINIGLSERPPWFCSLCNTKATSQQALLLHGDGKKHRAKVRAFTAKQQPNPPEEGAITNKTSTENTPKNEIPIGKEGAIASKESIVNTPKDEVPNDKSSEDDKENGPSHGVSEHNNSATEIGNISVKKRKKDTSNGTEKCSNGVCNGIVTHVEPEETLKKSKKARQETEVKGTEKKKAKFEAEKEAERTSTRKEGSELNIKWKKLIASVLKSTADGALKMKKLQKLVFKSLQESGIAVDEVEFRTTLEHKVNSSSKFVVDGKLVTLAV